MCDPFLKVSILGSRYPARLRTNPAPLRSPAFPAQERPGDAGWRIRRSVTVEIEERDPKIPLF